MIRITTCGPIIVLLFPGVLLQKISIGYIGTDTTIECPIAGDYTYPDWQGPPYDASGNPANFFDRSEGVFNPVLQNRFMWAANLRSLILTGTRRTDDGVVFECLLLLQKGTNTLRVRTRPSAPEISTSAPVDSNGTRATEGKALTVTCASRGGFPAPNVALYLGSINGLKLAEQSTGIPSGDTYTVTLNHVFVPTRQSDRQQLVCRSYYPTPSNAQDSQQTQTTLYLYLKPQNTRVAQSSDVTAGGEIAVECRTTGSRPAATIDWEYLSQMYTPVVSTTLNSSTQTFTTVSVLQMTVTAADNGQTVHCRVTHQAFTSTLAETGTLNVKFAVNSSSTSIGGNKLLTATGSNPLNLTCITGSSNPASSIVWSKSNVVISSNSPYLETSGQYNGIVRSQVLTLYPHRSEDGAVVTCSVSNGLAQVTDTASAILDLRYSPVVTIKANPQLKIVEQPTLQPVELPCSVDSKPISNVTWHHNSQVVKQTSGVSSLPYIISSPSRTSYGSYTCMADNGVAPTDSRTYKVDVQFRPLGITIHKAESIIADGRNNMSVSCVTNSSNPVALVTWSTGNIQTSTPSNTETPGQYGGTVLKSTVTFTPTRDHDGAVLSCAARNTVFHNQEVSENTTIDNIMYSPLIAVDPNKTVIEGDGVILKCSGGSKPAASFRWSKDGRDLAMGSGTASYNGLDYTITNVSRTENGTYTCFADNKIPPSDSRETRLVVQYPPDVAIVAVNATVHKRSTTVTCDADGVPESYMYEGWLHTWNGHIVTRQEPLPASRVLNLTGLSYAHSGVYRCYVSNGIKDVVSYGEGNLLIKSYPILIDKVLAKSKEIKASGSLMKPFEIIFQYYSNAGNGSVSVRKINGTDEDVGEIHQRSVDVNLTVFQSEIRTLGTEVTVNVTIVEESQFGEYEINVTNEIDFVTITLIILALGPPETPVFVNNMVLDHHSVDITWMPGYHNGLNQTFVIQISTDNSSWQNITKYGDMSLHQAYTQRVDNLASSQLYFFRMLAVNGEGESQPTAVFSFQTLAKPTSVSNNIGMIAGGVAGGTVAALVVIAIIIFIVWRRKDVSSSGEANNKQTLFLTRNSNHNDGYDDGDEEVKNWLYESAGPPQAETVAGASTSNRGPPADAGDIYATVTKKAEVVNAMPNKNKVQSATAEVGHTRARSEGTKEAKMMKQKQNKHGKGDVYENIQCPINGNMSTSQSGDIVYEDTSITVKEEKKKPVGSDGLLYAELAFAPRKKGPTKIIGIEDRCEYTTIDLTKKAVPLPDSDDEDKPKQ